MIHNVSVWCLGTPYFLASCIKQMCLMELLEKNLYSYSLSHDNGFCAKHLNQALWLEEWSMVTDVRQSEFNLRVWVEGKVDVWWFYHKALRGHWERQRYLNIVRWLLSLRRYCVSISEQ